MHLYHVNISWLLKTSVQKITLFHSLITLFFFNKQNGINNHADRYEFSTEFEQIEWSKMKQ